MMPETLDNMAICALSHTLLEQLFTEHPRLEKILRDAGSETEALNGLKNWVLEELKSRPETLRYYERRDIDQRLSKKLSWSDHAAIRILDYIAHAGREFADINSAGAVVVNHPIKQLWLAATSGIGGATPSFFEDMLHLFRQFSGKTSHNIPERETILQWMHRYPSGLDPQIITLRQQRRDRILDIIIKKIERGEISHPPFTFDPEMSHAQKFQKVLQWWNDSSFHLKFAIRSPEELHKMLDNSLQTEIMNVLHEAEKAGMPFFVNPYYLSLLCVSGSSQSVNADLVIRDYIIYSRQLMETFGHIIAWEKEDVVESGQPNTAGWMLPSAYNIHRRYPDVAILIPDTMGRACGGLCSVCQRMYNFQKKIFTFDFDMLRPDKTWPQKLTSLMEYFENDSQLRDILISGGDAFMSSDHSLKVILDAVYTMALHKREANTQRKDGEKYAELLRVRLATRIPAYLPQRITPELANILAEFKLKASQIGIQQFIIQTHFVSPLEVTPESREAVQRLLSAGWIVTNQAVFTTAASRRGHTARLRQVLNEIGVLPYYTFMVKGYRENYHNFVPIARCVQEQTEERVLGKLSETYYPAIQSLSVDTEDMVPHIALLCESANVPFLATDRNVMNLPGVGKSLSFRVIGILWDGRRILEFRHDPTRAQSPIVERTDNVIIIESKSINDYLQQLEEMGEDVSEYRNVYGYSSGETEPRLVLYDYPDYDFRMTTEITNLRLESQAETRNASDACYVE